MRFRACGLLVAALALASGCMRTLVEHSSADAATGTGATSELDFWDGVAKAPAVSNRDAVHAIALSYGLLAEDAPIDFESEQSLARRRGWIGPTSSLVPNETACLGWISRAVCIESGIEGGITMRVFGPVPRYAVRELAYRGYLPESSEAQAISGLRLIALLSKVEKPLAPASPAGGQ
jgi:hypothetical protein